ncbi:MAG: DUF1858 domain-containing protein [Bacillota bacterium]|nr:DUF1858 domain-containing protein [Bacillota bacterium]
MKIKKEMTIFETIRSHPQAITVFKSFEMPCGGCMAVMDESIEKGAQRHNADLYELLAELNALFEQEGNE